MNESDKRPIHRLAGHGYRERQSGSKEPIEEAQMFFYADGSISGSFVCRTPETPGILWLFKNGFTSNGAIHFEMVHLELRYTRDPIATFSGNYDGAGTFSGFWESSDCERGRWLLHLRDEIVPHEPGPHWYGETDDS